MRREACPVATVTFDSGSASIAVTTDGAGHYESGALAASPNPGLFYVRQRWLDPATGRWLSVDPVEGEPRYGYVHNQAARRSDPTGLEPLSKELGRQYQRFEEHQDRTF